MVVVGRVDKSANLRATLTKRSLEKESVFMLCNFYSRQLDAKKSFQFPREVIKKKILL